jgi:hypothetical protein
MAHTHVNCTDVSTYVMDTPKRPEDMRDLILDTQRPLDTFQKNLEALRRSVECISDIHAVLTKIFLENDWDVSRLYQSHRLDLYRGFPGWFVDHKIERCYYQARTDYHFRPRGNVVTSSESVYADLEKCDRVAYKSMFEMGFMAGMLTSFVVLVAVGVATCRSHARRMYVAFLISLVLFSILYIQE